MTNHTAKGGFTMLELLIVIAIIGALTALILPSFGTFRTRQALSNVRDMSVAYLNEARSRTLAGVDGTNYSVRFETNRIVLFAGATYDPDADTNEYAPFDAPVLLSNSALAGGGNTVTFDRLTGTTSDYGTLSFVAGAQTSTITINASGTIAQ
jgi:prepilin-type N-terminal cleavage/methylation domain-containing protein